jgi:hypothetical protein
MPTTLVRREERKDENKRTLIVLLGIMVLLVTVSILTIVFKH